MSLLALLLAAASPAAPAPADLKGYRDWTVGCDNGLHCQAVALIPEDDWDAGVPMSVRRGPEPNAVPVITFETRESGDPAGLQVDGKRLPVSFTSGEIGLQVAPKSVPALIQAFRTGSRLDLLSAAGKPIGHVTLAGASAALLYMDEKQKRLGTVTALARPGTAPASAVPPPPALPVLTPASVPKGPAITLPPARLAALRKQAGCDSDESSGPVSNDAYRIDAATTLILLSCGAGAYNFSTVPFLATQRRGKIEVRIAAFDHQPHWWEKNVPMLINADWAPETRTLVSFAKARGIGDCGTTANYIWDGTRFRLSEMAEMGECRGSLDYITVWRTKVVNR
ncbi:MAG TPA: DUF1176 domain-containing protein [Allosphingosinicella sp.]|jgi:hypothetical protein